MRRMCLALGLLLLAAVWAGCGGGSDGGSADGGGELTFVSFGGSYQDAEQKAFTDPFAKSSGVEVLQDGPIDYAKLKVQVESQQVTWDVVDTDPFFAIANCGELLEPLDRKIVTATNVDKDLLSKCSVPAMKYSTVLMYNEDKYGDAPPTGSVDLFDTDKYPGKRAIYNSPYGGALEAALLADGVAAEDLYPLDVDRALEKLSTIRDDLQLYDTGAQSTQLITSGEADMVFAWSGRAYDAVKQGAKYEAAWGDNMGVYDVISVTKGSANAKAGMELLQFSTRPEPQAVLAETISYAPINSKARPKVDALVRSFMTSEPEIASKTVLVDQQWWADNYDEALKKWTDWANG